MAEFNFEFDFDSEDAFAPTSFQDKIEKLKLKEFEKEMQAKDSPARHARIAEIAYYRAEKRGFQPGCELDDWLEAEKEFIAQSEMPSI